MNKNLKLLLELTKVRITFAVTVTTVSGYLLAAKSFDAMALIPIFGLFILACGSAALNQYQEYEQDAKMERTKDRPIPSGQISPLNTLLIALGFVVLGSLFLFFGSGIEALSLGLLALIWYNLIYTPLKKRTPYAVIPGSIIGAIPPLVGWVIAGKSILEPQALFLGFFFFVWQVPHFWLLMMKYGKQYKTAGFYSLSEIYTEKYLRYSTFVWVVATATAGVMLPAFHVVSSFVAAIAITLFSVGLLYVFSSLLKDKAKGFKPMSYFMKINYYVLALNVIFWLDALIV